MKFASIILLASVCFTNVVADYGQVKSDTYEIGLRVIALNEVIDGFPSNGGTVQNGLNIKLKVDDAKKALDKCAADAKISPRFSDAESKALFDLVTKIATEVFRLLSNVITKKPFIDKIPFPGVDLFVSKELQSLKESADVWGKALSDKSTAAIQADATKLKQRMDEAFDKSIKAYS